MNWSIKIGLIFLTMIAVMALVLMLLWNWLMPYLFQLPVINFWQAAGLLLMSKIIFGFGTKPGIGHHKPKWKPKFAEKWQSLSDDDKAKWKARFAEKWDCKQDYDKKEELKQV